MLDTETCGRREWLGVDSGGRWNGTLHVEERLRSRVGSARQVEPQRHLATAEVVRLALAESERAFGDRLVAAAAFGAAARGGFDDVCHVEIIEGGGGSDARGPMGPSARLLALRSPPVEPLNASSPAASERAATTAFSVLAAISFCHLLNDMMQSLLPALYPILKENYALTFGQIGIL